MAKLITHHDPFHVHKILGVLVLAHFLYRFLYGSLIRGFVFCSSTAADGGLCPPEQVHYDAACIILHGLLSWSSLLLPLPLKRNFSSPMIWMEFRWHSITFATRAVVGSLVSLYGLWPENLVMNYGAKMALILGTCYAADFITAKYGCTEKRTTNAMPYPDCITPDLQQNIKYNYAMKQFAAALSCVSEDPTLAWATLLAIQGAPLLMTLVRKGKVSSLTYHRTYILQLATPMYIFLLGDLLHWNDFRFGQDASSEVIQSNAKAIFVVALVHFLTSLLRLEWRQSKEVTWGISVGVIVFLVNTTYGQLFVNLLHTHPLGRAFLVWRYFSDSQGVMRHYVPVFTLADKAMEDCDDVMIEYISNLIGRFMGDDDLKKPKKVDNGFIKERQWSQAAAKTKST